MVFKAYGDWLSSQTFLRFFFPGFPFLTETGLKNPEEILIFFEIIAEASFKVKSKGNQNHYVIDHLKEKGISSNLKFIGK